MEKLVPAVQAAKAKLNTCSDFSQKGCHEEACFTAVEVREEIDNSLLPRAIKLSCAGDKRAKDVVKELRVLQCAALLAQALDTQQVQQEDDAVAQATSGEQFPSASGYSSGPQSLYIEANQLAESFLPRIHPMVALTRSLCDECGVSARSSSEAAPVMLPALASKGSRTGSKGTKSPANSTPSGSPKRGKPTVVALPECAGVEEQVIELPVMESEVRTASPTPIETLEKAVKIQEETDELLKDAKVERQRPKSKQSSTGDDEVKQETAQADDAEDEYDENYEPKVPRNIFKEYLADYKLEIEMSKPWFNCKQDEMRKHVYEQARYIRLDNQSKDINELANPKFTGLGHKMYSRVLNKANGSRSDPNLMHGVKMMGVSSAEAFHTSKLRLQLDPKAKPMQRPQRKKRIADE